MIRTTLLVAAVSPVVAGCATASRGSCDSSPVPVALPSWEVPGLEDATGAVTLSVLVDEQGRTRGLRIQDSSGHPMFDETIRFTVQSTRFEPARVNCDPVEQWMTVTVPVGHVGISSYLNKDEMHMALVREYPPLLRDADTRDGTRPKESLPRPPHPITVFDESRFGGLRLLKKPRSQVLRVYLSGTVTGSASWSCPSSTRSISSAINIPATGAFLNWFPEVPTAM